jgi:hypothetical protein
MAVLGKPASMWPEPLARSIDTWEDRIGRAEEARKAASPDDKDLPKILPMILNDERPGRVSMSLFFATSIKRTSGKKSIRVAIARKLKTALNLVVVRGANVARVKGKPIIVFNEQEALKGDHLILRGTLSRSSSSQENSIVRSESRLVLLVFPNPRNLQDAVLRPHSTSSSCSPCPPGSRYEDGGDMGNSNSWPASVFIPKGEPVSVYLSRTTAGQYPEG